MPISQGIAGRQYGAVYGRKRRLPYRAFIESQIPRLYQSKQRMEEKGVAEAELGLEEERLGLETQALEESRRASEASLGESIRISGIQAGLQKQKMEEAKKAGRTGTAISGAQTAGLGVYGASKLGWIGAKKAPALLPSAFKAPGVPTAAGTAPTSTASTGVPASTASTGVPAATAAPATWGPYAAGAAGTALVGEAAAALPIGSGYKTGLVKGTAAGAGLGGYLAAGTALGGPLGAIGGGLLGLAAAEIKPVEKIVSAVTGGK